MGVLMLNGPDLGKSQRQHDDHAQSCEPSWADQELGLGHAPSIAQDAPVGGTRFSSPRPARLLQRAQEVQQVLL